jgi:hypothetical protein
MKNKKDWKENKIVKKIIKLNEDYEFRFAFAGCSSFGETKIENMWECKCCGTLTNSLESLYHKTKEDGIGICSSCSNLWRAIPFSKIKT